MKQAAAGTWEQAQLASSPLFTQISDLFLPAARAPGESARGRSAGDAPRAPRPRDGKGPGKIRRTAAGTGDNTTANSGFDDN